LLHPQAVIPVRLGGKAVPEGVVRSVQAFVILYIGIFVIASLAMTLVLCVYASEAPSGSPLSADGATVTAVASVAATLNNIGPGLTAVGPGDWRAYSWIPPSGKVILILCMLVGRLEVFTVVLLFTPWLYR
jgi:trk system potassium uptake protein TrkH